MINPNRTIEIQLHIAANKSLNDEDKILWGCIYTFQKLASLRDAVTSWLLSSATDYDIKIIDESLDKMLSLNLIKSKYCEAMNERTYEVI